MEKKEDRKERERKRRGGGGGGRELVRERERERERVNERERERERGRQRVRDRDRERQTETERDRETERRGKRKQSLNQPTKQNNKNEQTRVNGQAKTSGLGNDRKEEFHIHQKRQQLPWFHYSGGTFDFFSLLPVPLAAVRITVMSFLWFCWLEEKKLPGESFCVGQVGHISHLPMYLSTVSLLTAGLAKDEKTSLWQCSVLF